MPVAVIVALAATQLLARGMTSPLREMTAAARTMATGDYSHQVTATSSDEVGELARTFNAMAADLALVDRQRRDLVANVSHELRTPVSALRALLENLVDGVVRPDADRLQVGADPDRAARQAGDRPARPVPARRRDRPSSRRPGWRCAPSSQDAVREARLAEHPVRFVVEVDPFDLVVHADRARLHQLLANLLDNAGRHSPAGGTVRVRAYRGRGGMIFEVADQGPGIAPADRDRVFERFSTGVGGPPADAPDGGTGLGLAIARWVTELHGGTIEVVDRPRGCLIRAAIPHPEHHDGASVIPDESGSAGPSAHLDEEEAS